MTSSTNINDNAREIQCLGYALFADNLSSLPSVETKTLISTINQCSYCIGQTDPAFRESLEQSQVLLPDGVGMVLATKLLTGQKIKKIAGADLHQFLLERLNSHHGSCFYMGSSENTLSKIKKNLAIEYPHIRVETYSPPFADEFTEEQNSDIINAVNAFKPDVLFVGMTAPKQEKWSYKNKDALDTHTICSIGAVFDFYAGTVERPSQFLINHGLEWLGRLAKEPRRMAKRYIYLGFKFMFYLVQAKITGLRNKSD